MANEETQPRGQTHLKAETYFRELLEQAPFSIQVFAPDGSTLLVNPAWERFWGAAREAALGYNILGDRQLMDKGIMPFVEQGFAGVATELPAVIYDTLETPQIDAPRRRRWVRAHIFPIKNDQGTVLEVVLVHEDITGQQLAERALHEEQERFYKVFRSNPDPILITRMSDGLLLEVNAGFERVTGYPREKALGRTTLELGLWKNPEDRVRFVEELSSTGQVREQDAEILTRGGETRWCQLSSEPLELDGQRSIVTVARDNSESKRAEQALSKASSEWNQAMDFFDDAIYIIDLDDRLVRANRAFHRLTGLTPEQAIGQDIARIIHPQGEAIPCPICQARRERRDALITMEADHPDNPTGRPIEVMVKIIRDAHGEPLSVLMGIHDLSRHREVENELRLHRDRLEDLVQERTQGLEASKKELETFSYSVSHDLRAPLRAIDGFAQALLEDHAERLDRAGRDYLRRVRAASGRMGELIDDLLRLSRVTRGAFVRETVDLTTLAEATLARLQETEPGREVEIAIARGLSVRGDRRLLRILLDNLLGNAWKYTRRTRHPRIEFAATQVGGHVRYSIADNGAGFDMQYADRLFGPFQRMHNSTQFEGTGIGLATVQRIVNRHGGRVWAEASVDAGATFYFTLPD